MEIPLKEILEAYGVHLIGALDGRKYKGHPRSSTRCYHISGVSSIRAGPHQTEESRF
jgi:hypothetical protein